MKLAIVYYSESGNTKQAAEYVAEGMKKAGAEVGLFELDKIDEAFVAEAKAVVFGAPTFYADTCWQMKKWFDTESASVNLAGKLGGVYSTAHFAQGGGDVAILTLIGHLLVKGMLVYSGGAALGKPFIHLGPVALDAVEGHYESCKADFEVYGERFAQKALELFGN